MKCDVCDGMGWTTEPSRKTNWEWADPCKICLGSGKLTYGRIARLLNEDDETVRRVARMKARPKTAARVFEKACEVLGWGPPKKQPDLFNDRPSRTRIHAS